MQNKLFVRNLSFNTTDTELSDLFSDHGKVVSARMAMEKATGRPRGFAFVEMTTQESAENAIRALDQSDFNGRTLYVAMSEQQGADKRTPRSSYGNSW